MPSVFTPLASGFRSPTPAESVGFGERIPRGDFDFRRSGSGSSEPLGEEGVKYLCLQKLWKTPAIFPPLSADARHVSDSPLSLFAGGSAFKHIMWVRVSRF